MQDREGETTVNEPGAHDGTIPGGARGCCKFVRESLGIRPNLVAAVKT